MEDLKKRLSFTKEEMKELFALNCHTRAKCDHYQEEIQEL